MNFNTLINLASKNSEEQILVASWAVDLSSLQACLEALKTKFVSQVHITGDKNMINKIAADNQIDISLFDIHHTPNPIEACDLAVSLIYKKQANILMKGLVNTSTLLKAVLKKEGGLRTEKLLSHIAVIELSQDRMIFLTDGGINIRPNIEEKVQIIDNATDLALTFKITSPKVALIAAVETVNPKMPETLDAAIITQMNKRKQIKNTPIIDGPLALDNAISLSASKHKKIDSPVAGNTDILVVPDITTGNVLYKSLTHINNLKSLGLIVGAQCPIILTSRADTKATKVNSIAAASLTAQRRI